MNEKLNLLVAYIVEQGKQASTWRGVIAVATSLFAWNLPPEKATAIITIGVFAFGLVGMLLPDQIKPKEPPKGTP